MKKLHFSYRMEIRFSMMANNHRFTVKCLPLSNEMQNTMDFRLKISPEVPVSYSSDAFGNRFIYGIIEQPHSRFIVDLEGTALCGMQSGQPVRQQTLAMYRYQSVMTKPKEVLTGLWKEIHPANTLDVTGTASWYMRYLYEHMSYCPGTTNTATTAEEAAQGMKGVCQDYAHIMLSLLRMARIPCRYVVGFMQGEGASHAWVEVADGDVWYGFDPTNGRRTDDSYLYVSCGRDARDCLMNRGVFTGGGLQTQTIYANLDEIAETSEN